MSKKNKKNKDKHQSSPPSTIPIPITESNPPTPVTPLQSAEEANIHAEEMIKCKAKEQFEKGKRYSRRWFWWLLNKPIANFFLASILLGLITTCYQGCVERSRREEQKQERVRRIATELRHRIIKSEAAVNGFDAKRRMDGGEIDSTYPENKDIPLVGLLRELGNLLPRERENLKCLAEQWDRISDSGKVDKTEVDNIRNAVKEIVQSL